MELPRNGIWLMAMLLGLSACQLLSFEPEPKNNPESSFETIWNDFDEFYAGFEARHIDWDSVYRVYRPMVSSKTTELELYNIVNNMLYVLRDAHVTLKTKTGTVAYQIGKDGYPKNFFGTGYAQSMAVTQFDQNPSKTILYGMLKGNIGYMHINSFSAAESEYNVIDKVIEEFAEAKGIIVDVRDNGGGVLKNADIIANRFADQKRIGQYFRWRRSPVHNDLSDYEPSYLNPDGPLQYTGKVVILTNRFSFSATEYFIGHMKALPYVMQMGGASGGGSGIAYTRDLPNGWLIAVPRTVGYNHKKELVEWVGFTPDLLVNITADDEANGFDRILQTAIDTIN